MSKKETPKGHYQPVVEDERFWSLIKKNNFDIPEGYLVGGERNCLDRLAPIIKDIKKPGSVLDIGCNIGFFSHVLQFLGNKVTGVENDVHVEVKKFTEKSSIDTAKELNKQYHLDVEFIAEDFIDYLKNTKRNWDYCLFLSVFHHLFIGYGYSDENRLGQKEAVKVLQLVAAHTSDTLYFEIDDKVLEEFGWGQERIRENLLMYTNFDKVEELFVSMDGWAKPRVLYKCTREKKKRTTPMGEPVWLSASRKNNIGLRIGESLFVSREASDWTENHLYGYPIDRKKVTETGEILKAILENPHENVCRILSYSDNWVELEYIEGKILSNKTPYVSDHTEKDYLDENKSSSELSKILESVIGGLRHLHKIGVVHTDLTAFNVMIDKTGTVKIIDVVGCVGASKELIELDWQVFLKYFVGELLSQAEFPLLVGSDEKMQKDLSNIYLENERLREKVDRYEKTISEIQNSRGWRLIILIRKTKDKLFKS